MHPDDAQTSGNGNADPANAFGAIPTYVRELGAYANHYVSAKLDAVKLSLRNAVILSVAGVLAGVLGAAVLATAVVLLLTGIAHGLGAAMGGRNWLGELIVGAVVIAVFAAVVRYALGRLKAAVRREMVRKYEAARQQQRSRFGHDVADEAAAAGRVAN
jgi:uncharacterized membrane protein